MGKKLTLDALLKADKPQESIKGLAFEDGMQLLEEVAEAVESGSLSLEESVSCYERAVALIAHLRAELAGAEEKLKTLREDSAGQIVVEEREL